MTRPPHGQRTILDVDPADFDPARLSRTLRKLRRENLALRNRVKDAERERDQLRHELATRRRTALPPATDVEGTTMSEPHPGRIDHTPNDGVAATDPIPQPDDDDAAMSNARAFIRDRLGIPEHLHDRISGNTPEDLIADARNLQAAVQAWHRRNYRTIPPCAGDATL